MELETQYVSATELIAWLDGVQPSTSKSSLQLLENSLRHLGVLQPLTIYSRGESAYVVDGRKRLQLLRRPEFASSRVPVYFIAESAASPVEAVLWRLHLQATSTALITEELVDFYKLVSKDERQSLQERLTAALAPKAHVDLVRQLEIFAKLPFELQHEFASKRLPLSLLSSCGEFDSALSATLASRVGDFRASHSEWRQLLTLLAELRRLQLSCDELSKLLSEASSLKVAIYSLDRRRRPHWQRFKEVAAESLEELDLPRKVRLDLPKDSEGEKRLTMNFSRYSEFVELIEQLHNKSTDESFKRYLLGL